MKSIVLIASVLVVLSVYCITSADGLECYYCGYAEGVDLEGAGDNIDKSCKDGKKPNKKYKGICASQYDSCAKLVYGGSIGDKDIKVTVRGCLSTSNEVCKAGNQSSIVSDPSTPIDIRASLGGLPGGFDVTYCTCKGDNCNPGSILQVTQGLLIVSFSVIASKFAGIF